MGGAVALTALVLVTVNAERVEVPDGGGHPLCQAIPVSEVRVGVRGPRGARVRVVLDRPRGADLRRTVRLGRRSGRAVAVFVPPHAFTGGRHVVRADGARRSFRLTEDVRLC